MREVKKRKQKLQGKFKNTPSHTSLVACTVSPLLNRDQSLSVKGKVRTCNNLEVNLRPPTGGLKAKSLVYVKSVNGKPLMPCTPAKARHLLRVNKARVVGCYPFRIQLLFECENKVQDVTLGVDTGYEHVGFSAVSSKSEMLCGEIELENGMSSRLIKKAMYRRGRRRRLWHRESKFDNKKNMTNRVSPSVNRRIITHVEMIRRILQILPISRINIEVANFDIAKLENPNISGSGYERGNLYGHENIKAFLIAREDGKCQLCSGEYDGNGWHSHHITPRSWGGTDRPENRALLHKKCHDKLHRQGLYDRLRKSRQYKAEIFMSTSRFKILEQVSKIHPSVYAVYGYETKIRRLELGLEKTHVNDAFVIAGGLEHSRTKRYILEQKKRNNRQLQQNRKGYSPSIRRQRYGIQPQDIFWVNGKRYVTMGLCNYGRYISCKNSPNVVYFPTNKIERYLNVSSWFFYN